MIIFPHNSSRGGFSFIELLVYMTLFVFASTLLVGILSNVVRIQNYESSVAEVNSQTQFVLQTIRRSVRQSSHIEDASSSLRLRMASSSLDPTVIYVENNIVYIQEGTSDPYALTNDRVIPDSLVFTRFSNAPGNDVVAVDMTLSYNTSNPQSTFSRTIESAISRVSAATFDSDLLPGSANQHDVGGSGQQWQHGFFNGNLTVGGNLTVDTNTLYVDSGGNRVGIGESNPASTLHIASSSYIQIGAQNGAPASTDCDAATELGRMTYDYANNLLYICDGASGWLTASTTGS